MQNEKTRTSTRNKNGGGGENAKEAKEALKTITTFMEVKKRNRGRNVIKDN